jgi:hypothetical protein
MARRSLVVLLSAFAALSVPATAGAASSASSVAPAPPAAKVPGTLRVCAQGPAGMDVFVDKADLHKEKRGLGAGACKDFALPKGKYAVTVVGQCADARDAHLTDLAVAPSSRALYQGTSLAGARVVRGSTTTWTATWECVGAPTGGRPLDSPPPTP